jgi:hypothetical protein
MDAVLSSTYLGLLMPLWIGIAPRRWSYYNDDAFTKLETYSCAFAMISMYVLILSCVFLHFPPTSSTLPGRYNAHTLNVSIKN